MADADALFAALQEDGIVVVPAFVWGSRLAGMQRAFSAALERLRANNVDGYEKTERLRDMIEHPFLLDQGFLDVALDPTIVAVVRRYVGPEFQLTECKGWRSRTTTKDWHGWHGDAWYDQAAYPDSIPREVKVGLYLTDVRSGGLAYVKGSHRQQRPRLHSGKSGANSWRGERVDVNGGAGTIVLFDTSGIHRQSYPVLEVRQALFYCYHDAAIALQAEDVAYNRYAPLYLNAAFLGGLTLEQQRILGFGDKRNFIPAYRRDIDHELSHSVFSWMLETGIWFEEVFEPVARRLRTLRSRVRQKPPPRDVLTDK